LFEKLNAAAGRFLDVTLIHLGSVPFDDYLRRSIQRQKTVIQAFSGSRSSRAFLEIADQISRWPTPKGVSGHLQFFIERLVQSEPDLEVL
jgi:flagellar biosynthesis protein FlhG